jgi:hypothetical protein
MSNLRLAAPRGSADTEHYQNKLTEIRLLHLDIKDRERASRARAS